MVNPKKRKQSPIRRPKAAPISKRFKAWLSIELGEVVLLRPCRFCGIDPRTATMETTVRLPECMNCWADLHCKGNWTGQAHNLLRALWAKKENRSSRAWLVIERVWKGPK